jgi:glucose-6-phosphate dehydrogenase assembly protein OpcA
MEDPVKVDVEAVEAELARIQRELTSSEVRASLFNLVVLSSDVNRAQADAALTYLLGKRAARVIHVVDADSAESQLEVSARCTVDDERKGVCFQEIVITNGRDGAGGAVGTWTPLLVRDIPTYVLWLDAIAGREALFDNAVTQVDKLIIDSDRAVERGDNAEHVLETLRRAVTEESVPIADFSWKRLRPFRQLAADAFSGGNVKLLESIATVTVSGLSAVATRLFGLWLAERLGWQAVTAVPGQTTYRGTGGREITVTYDDSEPGCDHQVVFELTDGRTIDLMTYENGCADIDFADGEEQRRMIDVPGSGEILLEEVDSVYADSLYRAAISGMPTA